MALYGDRLFRLRGPRTPLPSLAAVRSRPRAGIYGDSCFKTPIASHGAPDLGVRRPRFESGQRGNNGSVTGIRIADHVGGALLAFRAAGHWRDPRQPTFQSDVEAHRAADSQEPAPRKRLSLSLFLCLQTARSPDAQHKLAVIPRDAPKTIGHHSNWRKTLSDPTISQSPA